VSWSLLFDKTKVFIFYMRNTLIVELGQIWRGNAYLGRDLFGPRPNLNGTGSQRSRIVVIGFHLCVHHLPNLTCWEDTIWHGNTYGEKRVFARILGSATPPIASSSAPQFWGSPVFIYAYIV